MRVCAYAIQVPMHVHVTFRVVSVLLTATTIMNNNSLVISSPIPSSPIPNELREIKVGITSTNII